RLHEAWWSHSQQFDREQTRAIQYLNERQQGFQQARQRFDKARMLRLPLVMPGLWDEALYELRGIENAASRLGHLLQPSPEPVPQLGAWIDELRALETEFGEIQVDWSAKYLGITTAPITLEDIYLGPFAIHCFWERLNHGLAVHCFDVIAL